MYLCLTYLLLSFYDSAISNNIKKKITSFLKFLNVKWKNCPTFRLSNLSEMRENGKRCEFNCFYLIIVFATKKIRVKNIPTLYHWITRG